LRTKQIAPTLSLFALLFALPAYSQQFHAPHTQNVDGSAAPPGDVETRDQLMREMAKKANLERQAAIKNDTDKLVKLAAELKDYVDKSNENILSMNVLKKAEEIERLAHGVKDKMKGPN
jgi:oligoribonuclease NrnB/cAMP/cGMP phosphodiesterase (DHH superfamily)